jgi:hypothetical protein
MKKGKTMSEFTKKEKLFLAVVGELCLSDIQIRQQLIETKKFTEREAHELWNKCATMRDDLSEEVDEELRLAQERGV